MKKRIMIVAVILLIAILCGIIAYDVWFVIESFSVGSGMIIFVWILLFAVEVPIITVIIVIIIILCTNLHKKNK